MNQDLALASDRRSGALRGRRRGRRQSGKRGTDRISPPPGTSRGASHRDGGGVETGLRGGRAPAWIRVLFFFAPLTLAGGARQIRIIGDGAEVPALLIDLCRPLPRLVLVQGEVRMLAGRSGGSTTPRFSRSFCRFGDHGRRFGTHTRILR